MNGSLPCGGLPCGPSGFGCLWAFALMFIQAISELIKNVAAMAGKIELTNNSDEVAEAIEIVKSAEHLPDETGKEDIQ